MTAYFSAALPGLILFLLGMAWQSWRASSSEVAAQINDLIKDVRELEALATEYWTQGGSSSPKMKLLQVKMRGMTFVIGDFEAQSDILFRGHRRAFEATVDAFFIASTGGNFEVVGRKSDYARAITVKETAAALIAVARKARQESAGFVAVYWFFRRHIIWLLWNVSYPIRWLKDRKMRALVDAGDD